jgi:dihydroorotase
MILIKNAKLTDENIVDILIEDKTILKIDKNIKKNDAKIIDAKEAYILPTITDLNINIRDNNLNEKNLDEIENRALKAGIGTVVLNCNFTPDIENKTHLELLHNQLKSRKINFILNIKGLNHDNKLNDISILLKAGAKVIFENSDISTNNLRRISQYALMHKTPLFIFCQNRDLNENGVINESEVSFELGLPGISKVGEISEVAKVSAISEYYKVPTHFQTISTAKSIEIAKQNPLATIEVSLHHLLKSDESCKGFNTYAKINPPLRSQQERKKLLEALKDKKIDTITTLFSPQSITNKDLPFEQAKFGIDEIEEFLPLIYTYLVKSGFITMQDVEKLLCKNPAKILNQKEPSIKEGEKASFILFDTTSSKIYENKTSIYHDEEITGKINTIMIDGVTY